MLGGKEPSKNRSGLDVRRRGECHPSMISRVPQLVNSLRQRNRKLLHMNCKLLLR